ncbi:type 4a pilus biogenesis protein PilO [Shewanella sp. 202IG2-18]|uniref:type 4a pilus biogenesis protein PilO n=1 Tax=Parashewanella hymeniacidonis TaxID=2807618 RepID=UPI00196069F4|nr:type 4a pilus biogenesis protein PilO [Parashewanella hymeniacidonis]MBM7072294.1 type 4a pilus biogenesis protein PilO [Parashewanella hymeniacidonis]
MKLDLEQFNDLDFENIGAWPRQVKVVFAAILAILVFIGSYFFFISDELSALDRMQSKEAQLRNDFKLKYQMAANLKLYREQLSEMEGQFSELLKMLPSKNEMPGLLDDLTFVATDAGLRINSLNWEDPVQQDFYVELPIKISVVGDYHEIGNMISNIAKLPRIVSLHDFSVKKEKSELLQMEIFAKTYRFKEVGDSVSNKKKGKG